VPRGRQQQTGSLLHHPVPQPHPSKRLVRRRGERVGCKELGTSRLTLQFLQVAMMSNAKNDLGTKLNHD